jgi:hypothetical protein
MSDNATAGNADSEDVNWNVDASGTGNDSATPQASGDSKSSGSEVKSEADLASKVGRAPGDIAPAVLDINSSAAKPATTDVNAPAPDTGNPWEASTEAAESGTASDGSSTANVGSSSATVGSSSSTVESANATAAPSNATVESASASQVAQSSTTPSSPTPSLPTTSSPTQSSGTTPSVSGPQSSAQTSSTSENSQSGSPEATSIKSAVKVSSGTDTAATSAPQASPAQPEMSAAMKAENFARDEIRTLLVPVPPFNRLVACSLAIFCWSILGFIILKTPAGVNAQGMYTIDLPDAGSYVFFFRGDTQDAYGWTVDGRFRNSLRIDMDPVEPHQTVTPLVTPVENFKDLAGANFFSVAEFEVNQPGKYNLWIKWNNPDAKCRGKITYEKDPVETFFFKWALGIVGTIAIFYMMGIPMTTRKAQATLPDATPQVVTK